MITLLTLDLDGARLPLRVEPAGRGPAFAEGGGMALSYLGELPPALRPLVLALGERFRRGGEDPLATLRAGVREIEPRAALALVRRLPAGQRLPKKGRPPHLGEPRKGMLWPFDPPELVAFDIGLRAVIKSEPATTELAAVQRAVLADHGLTLRTVGNVYLAGRDAAALDAAVAAETSGDEAGLGALLGYPTCCVRAYLRRQKRDDLTLLSELLPPFPSPAATPLTIWISDLMALVSHAPCSLACAATARLTSALLDELTRRRAGFREGWLAFAQRVHAIDGDGRALAIAADTALRVVRADELSPDFGSLELPELAGVQLRVEEGMLIGPTWRAAFVADHRGPCELPGGA